MNLDRREFLRVTGISTLALLSTRWDVMAGPFTREDFDKLVPADKKLHPDWVNSLFARGTPEVYRGEELKWIGLPIGGLCAGQLYLGGDGRLWHWDIFNQHIGTGAGHYAKPMTPVSPLKQDFILRIGNNTRTLDKNGFADIRFRGEYPIGRVEYKADDVTVTLEAFSPFIPLNTDDSSLPATVMQFTVKNISPAPFEAILTGSLENIIARAAPCQRRTRVLPGNGFTFLECSAEKITAPAAPPRPDIVFEDFEGGYDKWTVEGTAFGERPSRGTEKGQQKVSGFEGGGLVNSYPGTDNATGKLVSKPFSIERRYITFLVGGGSHKGKTCLNLIVDGKITHTATGRDNERLEPGFWDVSSLAGQQAHIEIVDAQTGPWGHINVDQIVFTDTPPRGAALEQQPDFGTMGLALLGPTADVADTDPIGRIGRKLSLAPGGSETVTFVLTWHFPNLTMAKLPGGRFYATKFASALSVARYVADNFERLASQTRLWRDTWYDSTLPYWFLDRTFLNTSILATSTCYRFHDGRFYGWEGVGCCPGTCGHVWQYAHAVARLFPDLERDVRERVDFGLALKPDGAILFRGEHNNIPAVDAQAGTVLRALREHQMSANDAFLKRIWPGVKRATEWLIAKDADGDGIIESNQHNTLDTDWFGPVAWLSGLYLAALEAAAAMADDMGDAVFAGRCREISARGQRNLVEKLFDGEYFINKPDPKRPDTINSGSGCEIDQVLGQSWAWQVGLPRVFPQKETLSALRSLWRYNFTPDVGPYRERYKPGRWYAMPGEAGLLMCTFPRSDWDYAQAKGKGPEWAAGYFNECMNGFEYQVAGHMIWEGMLLEGLAVTRAVHDRYHPLRRNPYNEIECGDHYARSMASYGVYLAACGFECHGPTGHIGFAPRLTPDNFKAAFTCAEGWGSFRQTSQMAEIEVKYGRLRVKTVALAIPKVTRVRLNGQPVAFRQTTHNGRLLITLEAEATVAAGQKLELERS